MDRSRWLTVPKKQQLLNVAAEFARATVWQGKDGEKFRGALARALELIDLCLCDPQWRDETRKLLGLREEVAKFWTGENASDVAVLHRCL